MRNYPFFSVVCLWLLLFAGSAGAGSSLGAAAPALSVSALTAEETSLTVSPEKIDLFIGNLNEDNVVAVLTVDAKGLPGQVTLSFRGAHRSYFSVSSEVVGGNTTSEVTVTYRPDRIGMHDAYLDILCPDNENYAVTLRLRGACVDPANPPAISVSTEAMPEFKAKPDELHEQELTVESANMPDYVYASLEGGSESAFRLNSSMLMKNMSVPLKVTFAPLAEGVYHDRIRLTSVAHDTLYVTLSGVCEGEVPVGDVEGDELPLTTDNPRVLLQESFGTVSHNRPLSIDGWKNLAMEGQRAWWGYQFSDEDGGVLDSAAKVTAYDSKVEAGAETPCEMLLVTPPLDFKNAGSKYFTFRVMGNLLIEGQTDLLELCYLSLEGDELYINPVELAMPDVPDLNGEWFEYHLDLEGQPVDDVFFMGFRFRSTRGSANSATYYIDDVSFGRTDLPRMHPSVTSLAFEAVSGTETVSEKIEVSGTNLTEDIRLTVGGPNRSKFSVTPESLSASGGAFTVKFRSDEVGVHEAYVKLSSRGAADVFVPLVVNNKESGSGIGSIRFDLRPDITVFDLQGRVVAHLASCPDLDTLLQGLARGSYLLQVSSAQGIHVVKVCFDGRQIR